MSQFSCITQFIHSNEFAYPTRNANLPWVLESCLKKKFCDQPFDGEKWEGHRMYTYPLYFYYSMKNNVSWNTDCQTMWLWQWILTPFNWIHYHLCSRWKWSERNVRLEPWLTTCVLFIFEMSREELKHEWINLEICRTHNRFGMQNKIKNMRIAHGERIVFVILFLSTFQLP